jgi:hypothetical protein
MDPDFVIRVELAPGDPRVCDYCNKFLVDDKALTVSECHTTDYGLMCSHCIGSIKPIKSYTKGEDVSKEIWY